MRVYIYLSGGAIAQATPESILRGKLHKAGGWQGAAYREFSFYSDASCLRW